VAVAVEMLMTPSMEVAGVVVVNLLCKVTVVVVVEAWPPPTCSSSCPWAVDEWISMVV
jgi:hypothetical protein